MSQQLVMDHHTQDSKNLARIVYLIHGATFFFSLGMLSIVPLIINYVKRGETLGTIVYSHHGWMIRTFWWYIAWCVLAIVLMFTILLIPLAWLMFCVAWVWVAYRLVRGFLDLEANRAMPD